MKKKNGGKIIFTSTASASHGGGRKTMAYGIAKSGIETLTKGLARDGGKYKILVNNLEKLILLEQSFDLIINWLIIKEQTN